KNNYMFRQWTDAESILDYLVFARNYIEEQEQKHGRSEVEDWLDSCHALQNYGINRYKKPAKLSIQKEKDKQHERLDYLQSQVNELYNPILPINKADEKKVEPN